MNGTIYAVVSRLQYGGEACRVLTAPYIRRMETIADRLARKMRERGVTQYRLWKLSGVSQPTIKRILDGESKEPDKSTVEALARALETSYAELYDGAGPENVRMAGQSPDIRPIKAWNNEDELEAEYVTLPRLDLKGSCGNGNVIWQIDEKGQPQAFRKASRSR